jgi:hypothetical protein
MARSTAVMSGTMVCACAMALLAIAGLGWGTPPTANVVLQIGLLVLWLMPQVYATIGSDRLAVATVRIRR